MLSRSPKKKTSPRRSKEKNRSASSTSRRQSRGLDERSASRREERREELRDRPPAESRSADSAGLTTKNVGRSAARAFAIASLLNKPVPYDLKDTTIAIDKGVVGVHFNTWTDRKTTMARHVKVMKKDMNPELVDVCYETHLRNNLFAYSKRPHPNSWVYHPDVRSHMYYGGENTETARGKPPVESTDVLSTNFHMPLDKDTANASLHRVPVEVSSVGESFDADALREACEQSPNLAGTYFTIECRKCDMPGLDASGGRPCGLLLSEHVSDVRLADVDPLKIHPRIMLSMMAHVLHAVYVLHSHGFVHGAINADNIFVNYVNYTKDSAEILFGHGGDEGMCADYANIFTMDNREYAGAPKNPNSAGGLQLVLGGYNGIRKVSSTFCRTSDDVASVILTFAQKFGSDFVHVAIGINNNTIYAPLLPAIDAQGYTALVDAHIAHISRNLPGQENNEESIEKEIRKNPWLKMFTSASEALLRLCGFAFTDNNRGGRPPRVQYTGIQPAPPSDSSESSDQASDQASDGPDSPDSPDSPDASDPRLERARNRLDNPSFSLNRPVI